MKLEEWREQFTRKYAQYLDELGEMGEDTARTLFAEAPPEYGNSDVTVNRESVENASFKIIASGHDAAFLEFGTGVETVATRPTVDTDFPLEVGSWSRANEGEFYKTGYEYWHYNGQKMSGTPPTGAMQEACNAMEQWSGTIARRVFG